MLDEDMYTKYRNHILYRVFQKRFIRAKSKYNYSKSMRGNADIIRDAAMMLRAYKALEQELVKLEGE